MGSNAHGKGLPSPAESTPGANAMSKKGLPPLPQLNAKKTNSFFVPAHCGADSVALSSQSTAVQACSLSQRNAEATTVSIIGCEAEPSHIYLGNSSTCTSESFLLANERSPSGNAQDQEDVVRVARKGSSTASPGRPVRRGAQGIATRNFARGSPGRRGAWNSPGRGNGGRVSIRNLDRGSISSKGHVRPKDMLSRDGASVRISPVLNVAMPSLRGANASSKSRTFSLGNIFSKKDRVTSSRAYTVLPPPETQNGV